METRMDVLGIFKQDFFREKSGGLIGDSPNLLKLIQEEIARSWFLSIYVYIYMYIYMYVCMYIYIYYTLYTILNLMFSVSFLHLRRSLTL